MGPITARRFIILMVTGLVDFFVSLLSSPFFLVGVISILGRVLLLQE